MAHYKTIIYQCTEGKEIPIFEGEIGYADQSNIIDCLTEKGVKNQITG